MELPSFQTRGVLGSVALGALGVALLFSPLPEIVHEKVCLPASFRLRQHLDRAPALHPKLKLLAVDARAVSYLRKTELDDADWVAVMKRLEELGVPVVLIDRMFSVPSVRPSPLPPARSDARTRFVTGAFAMSGGFAERQPWDLNLLPTPQDLFGAPVALPAWLKPKPLVVYGAHSYYRQTFRTVGHLQINDDGRIQPLLSLEPDRLLPHEALYAATTIQLSGETLLVDGAPVPVGEHGSVLPNLVPLDRAWDRTYSLPVIFTERAPDIIAPGDVVMLLTDMRTGEAKYTMSPVGTYPEAFVFASLVNSVMQKGWIRTVSVPRWQGLIFLLMMVALAWALPASGSLVAVAVTPFSLYVSQFLLFCLRGVEIDVSVAALPGLVAGAGCFLARAQASQRRLRQLRHSLEGLMGNERLASLLKSPGRIQWKPSARDVTVIFVDMSGFSRLAEQAEPAQVYAHLKETITRITETVHELDGIVDRTMGDGVLAYFGYNLTAEEGDASHPETALSCAIEIQRRHLLALRANPKALVHPLRIGVNSGTVFVGDLGDNHRVDFTIVGHAVNFAQRLEAACEDFHVMVSEATWSRLSVDNPWHARGRTKLIAVKHARDPVRAFELNPVHDLGEAKGEALKRYREVVGLKRGEERIPVPKGVTIDVRSRLFSGTLANVSFRGAQIVTDVSLSKGIVASVKIGSLDDMLMEVRWSSRASDGSIQVGLRHVEASEIRLKEYFDSVRRQFNADEALAA